MNVPRPPPGPPPRPILVSSDPKDKKARRKKFSKKESKELKKLRLENDELKRQLIDREQTIMRLKLSNMGSEDNGNSKIQREDRTEAPIEGGALPRPAEVEKKKSASFKESQDIHISSGSENQGEKESLKSLARRPPPLQIDVSGGPVHSRPISSLLDGTRTLWRLPYNGKGGAQKRLVYVGLEIEKGSSGTLKSPGGAFVEFVSLTDLISGGAGPGQTHGSRKMFQLKSPVVLCWRSPDKESAASSEQHGGERELVVTSTAHVVRGHATPAFQKLVQKAASPSLVPRPELCFSLIASTRTVDLAAESIAEAEAWTTALQHFLQTLRMWEQGPANQPMVGYTPISPYTMLPSPYSSPVRHVSLPSLSVGNPQPLGSPMNVSGGSPMAAGGEAVYPTHPFQPHFGFPTPPSPMHGESNSGMRYADGTRPPSALVPTSPQAKHFFPEGQEFDKTIPPSSQRPQALKPKSAGKMEGTSWKERLFAAAFDGDVEQLSSVLGGGAPVDTPLFKESTNKTGKVPDTPLIVCARLGHINCLKLCLEHGARNDPFEEGITALHASVANNQYEAAELLLQMASKADAGAVVCSLTDVSGLTPLHLASQRGDVKMTELLLHHGADPRQRTAPPSTHGYTALHYAAEEGHGGVVEVLLDYDAELEAIDLVDTSGGNSALHLGVKANKIECVRLLLQSAANPLLRDNQGMKALDIAIKRGSTNLGVLLLEYENSLEKPSSNAPAPAPAPASAPVSKKMEDEKSTGTIYYDKEEEEESVQAALLASLAPEDKREEAEKEEVEKKGEFGGGEVEVEVMPLETFTLSGENWTVHLADEEGISYYYNVSTGHSSWEDPRDYVPTVPSPEPSPKAKAPHRAGGMFTEIVEEKRA